MAAIERGEGGGGGGGGGERVLRIQVHERDERITFLIWKVLASLLLGSLI